MSIIRDDRFLEASKTDKTVPCIRCNKPLVNITMQDNHPLDAVYFRSYGQYGSTQFDPGDGTYLEINLCDECVKSVAKTHIVSFDSVRTITPTTDQHDSSTALRDRVRQAAAAAFKEKD